MALRGHGSRVRQQGSGRSVERGAWRPSLVVARLPPTSGVTRSASGAGSQCCNERKARRTTGPSPVPSRQRRAAHISPALSPPATRTTGPAHGQHAPWISPVVDRRSRAVTPLRASRHTRVLPLTGTPVPVRGVAPSCRMLGATSPDDRHGPEAGMAKVPLVRRPESCGSDACGRPWARRLAW